MRIKFFDPSLKKQDNAGKKQICPHSRRNKKSANTSNREEQSHSRVVLFNLKPKSERWQFSDETDLAARRLLAAALRPLGGIDPFDAGLLSINLEPYMHDLLMYCKFLPPS